MHLRGIKGFFRIEFEKRSRRDSNPRCLTAQRFSRPPQSTTLPLLRITSELPMYSPAVNYNLHKTGKYCKSISFKNSGFAGCGNLLTQPVRTAYLRRLFAGNLLFDQMQKKLDGVKHFG